MAVLEAIEVRLGEQIARKLRDQETRLRQQWANSAPSPHIVVDDLLPAEEARSIFERRPALQQLLLKRSLRESKWVGVDIEGYDPLVSGSLLAFQNPAVVEALASITGMRGLRADPSLYASGISVMTKGDFLNPHLDNSHDGDQKDYRALNLLYYVSPDWKLEYGGNLELWKPDLRQPTVIESRFNRLVVIATNDASWHSVQPLKAVGDRVCISNYYFSAHPPADHDYRHVTSFRGRPEEPLKKVLLRLDSMVLNTVGRMLPGLLRRNKHRRSTK